MFEDTVTAFRQAMNDFERAAGSPLGKLTGEQLDAAVEAFDRWERARTARCAWICIAVTGNLGAICALIVQVWGR